MSAPPRLTDPRSGSPEDLRELLRVARSDLPRPERMDGVSERLSRVLAGLPMGGAAGAGGRARAARRRQAVRARGGGHRARGRGAAAAGWGGVAKLTAVLAVGGGGVGGRHGAWSLRRSRRASSVRGRLPSARRAADRPRSPPFSGGAVPPPGARSEPLVLAPDSPRSRLYECARLLSRIAVPVPNRPAPVPPRGR